MSSNKTRNEMLAGATREIRAARIPPTFQEAIMESLPRLDQNQLAALLLALQTQRKTEGEYLQAIEQWWDACRRVSARIDARLEAAAAAIEAELMAELMPK